MVLQLTPMGSAATLVIDESLLRAMKLSADSLVDVKTDGERLLVSPADADSAAKFRAAMEQTHARYGRALQRLAD